MNGLGYSNIRVRKQYFWYQLGAFLQTETTVFQCSLYGLVFILFVFEHHCPVKRDIGHNLLQERQGSNLMETLVVQKEDSFLN